MLNKSFLIYLKNFFGAHFYFNNYLHNIIDWVKVEPLTSSEPILEHLKTEMVKKVLAHLSRLVRS